MPLNDYLVFSTNQNPDSLVNIIKTGKLYSSQRLIELGYPVTPSELGFENRIFFAEPQSIVGERVVNSRPGLDIFRNYQPSVRLFCTKNAVLEHPNRIEDHYGIDIKIKDEIEITGILKYLVLPNENIHNSLKEKLGDDFKEIELLCIVLNQSKFSNPEEYVDMGNKKVIEAEQASKQESID